MASYLITGCSRGIGLATASHLASLSKDNVSIIFATARSHSSALDKLVQDSAGRVIFLNIETTNKTSVSAAATEVEKILGDRGLDVLINNAGITAYTPGWTETLTDLNHVFNVNVNGTNIITTTFLPLLRKSSVKKIINISSSFGSIELAPILKYPGPAYIISKTALNSLTKQWALALDSEGFTVLALSPGWVKTETFGGDAAHLTEAEAGKGIVEAIARANKADNGLHRSSLIPGWEEEYNGKVIPW
ncbi:short chain oxidoreductase [Trichoderma sp. SZMC 28014]